VAAFVVAGALLVFVLVVMIRRGDLQRRPR